MATIEIKESIEQCDVLIIGGGIAGTTFAYLISQAMKSSQLDDLNIIMIEKRRIGSHNPSYYVPMDLINDLNLQHLIKGRINSLIYETDTIESSSLADAPGGFANIPYVDMCEDLVSRSKVDVRYDGFLQFNKRAFKQRIVELESGKQIQAKVIIDATGWESPVRSDLGLTRPIRGAKTVLWELENCNIEKSDQMTLGVGDFASLGFWQEPQLEHGKMLAGSGFWDDLRIPTTIEEKNEMDRLLILYLMKYHEIYSNATLVRKQYSKISVDPVSTVVHDNVISIGESAGMSNPYWLLGSTLIYNFSKIASDIVVRHVISDESLKEIQSYWNSQKSEYGKLWAASYIMWQGGAKEWKSIFDNRENAKKYTTKEQVIERQKGGSYGLSYAHKLLGTRRILRIGYYLLMYHLRMRNDSFYNRFRQRFRKHSLVEKSIHQNEIEEWYDRIHQTIDQKIDKRV